MSLLCWAPVPVKAVVAYVVLVGLVLLLAAWRHRPSGCGWCHRAGPRRAAVPVGRCRLVRRAFHRALYADGLVVVVLVVCAALGILLGSQVGVGALGAGYALVLWACRCRIPVQSPCPGGCAPQDERANLGPISLTRCSTAALFPGGVR